MLTHSSPCLFLKAEEWEQIADKRADPYFARDLDTNDQTIERVEAMFASAPDNGIHIRSYKNIIPRYCIAWYDQKRDKDLERALYYIRELCEHEELWQPREQSETGIHHADLTTGEALFTSVFAYDVLYPYLAEADKQLILKAICNMGLARYLKGLEDHDWWEHCNFNWATCLHGNAGLAALCIAHHDPALSEHVLTAAKEGCKYVIDNFPADGGWTEGVMYLSTTMGHLTDFIRPLYELCGDDLGVLSNERIIKTLEFNQYMNTEDGGNFNLSNVDSERGGGAVVHTYWYANKLDRPDLIYGADRCQHEKRQRLGLFFNYEALWMRKPFQKEEKPQLDKLKHFRELDWVTWHGERPGWRFARASVVAIIII